MSAFRHILNPSLFKGQVFAPLAGSIAFVAALVTLWGPATSFLWSKNWNVYILHPYSSGDTSLWNELDKGMEDALQSSGALLDGLPLSVGEYQLHFIRRTWTDDVQLEKQIRSIGSDKRALALILATNSHHAQLILRSLPEARRLPILLATATKGSLLREADPDGVQRPARGVFRLVAPNYRQAHRLASTILTPDFKTCNSDKATSVAILREEVDNAAFSRDLAMELTSHLDKAQRVKVVVNASVDTNITVPRELVELAPDFLVYIGSLRNALTFQEQISIIQSSSGGTVCLPIFIVPDAGIINSSDARKGKTRGRVLATLPLSEGEEQKYAASLGFERLGADSIEIITNSARAVLQSGTESLTRKALLRELSRIELEGEALQYKFKDGENVRADFHLWECSGDDWKHSLYCRSEEHTSFRELVSLVEEPAGSHSNTGTTEKVLLVGGKPFTEQYILAELAVNLFNRAKISAHKGPVSLNGIRDLLLLQRIDSYWEYTGSVLDRVYKEKKYRGESAVQRLRELDDGSVVWMEPLPANNTFVLVAKKSFAHDHGVQDLSGLAKFINGGGEARLCTYGGFLDIEDGLGGLEVFYDFSWPRESVVTTPTAVIYDRFSEYCEVMVVFRTDARLASAPAVPLKDDKGFFPEYRPSLVVRDDVYRKLENSSPEKVVELKKLVACLGRHLDEDALMALNAKVELKNEPAEEVAEAFIEENCG